MADEGVQVLTIFFLLFRLSGLRGEREIGVKIGSHRTREIPGLTSPPLNLVSVPSLCPGEDDDENNSFLELCVVEKRFGLFWEWAAGE